MNDCASRTCSLLVCVVAWWACAASGCSDAERCGVPGVVAACACADGSPGARVCAPEKSWRACDCSGAIALPNPVSDGAGGDHATAGTGGAAGSAGRGGGGAGSSGAGGAVMPPDGDEDGGGEPMSGTGGSSGAGGTDAAVPDAGPGDPLAAYRGCATTADCEAGAMECTITPSFPTNYSVCAPACIDTGDCPVPDGLYEAVVSCVTGRCRLDCTPVLFAPLLTCPTGMTCIAPQLGVAFCHDDGI